MNATTRVSAVVPIYNSRPFLFDDGMLSCLLEQTFPDFEIVLVNDGSKDDSLDICNAYAADDRRIVVVNQENGGESAARNTGIEAASGDYVLILDHDDHLESNAIELFLRAAHEHGSDIVRSNYVIVSKSGVVRHATAHPAGTYDSAYIRSNVLPAMIGIDAQTTNQLPGHWTYMHRRAMLIEHGVRYDPTKRKETDHRFAIDALNAAESITLLDEPLYRFVKRAGSNTSSYSPRFDNIMDNFAHYEQLFGDEYEFNSSAKISYNISFVQESVTNVLIHEKEVPDKREEIIRILSDPRVVEWYKALTPKTPLSKLVKMSVASGRFELAYLAFEGGFLKSRAGRLFRR